MAWLIQYLSAKLGIVTGRSLPETLGRRIRNRVGPPRLLAAGRARRDGDRHRRGDRRRGRAEPAVRRPAAVGRGHHRHGLARAARGASRGAARAPSSSSSSGCVAIIAIGFTFGVFIAPPDPAGVVGGLVPRFEDTGSVLLAASILGATIMPHAIYAHSALARDRFAPRRREQSGGARATRHRLARLRHRRGTDAAPSSPSRSCAASRPRACCAPRGGTSRSRCSSPAP